MDSQFEALLLTVVSLVWPAVPPAAATALAAAAVLEDEATIAAVDAAPD